VSAGHGSSTPETALLSPQNPWPGLVSFSEANEAFFFGREQEIADLVRRIAQEPLTIFFGKSGLGKSSILQAGLTPELRRHAFVPIYIRLDYAAQAPPLATQALDHIRGTLDREAIDAPRPAGDQTLWEYFHSVGCDWWDHHNQLVKPILMFDQFEELLTLGQSTPAGAERIQDFLRELEDLVDNRVPSELEIRLSAERGLGQQFDFNRTACHIILALREDYLADLESLHERLRPIMRNRFRLLPMNTQQAVDVILKPGKDLVDPDVALKIVQFVSSSEHGHCEPGDGDATLQVEPALLSVVLQELNNRRLQRGQEKVSEDLLGEGHAADILQHFYERGLQDLDPQVGDFIVDHLLTASGARNRIAEEDALTKPGITPRVIAVLIDRRIIQRQSSGHMKWLELTHDTLADVVNRGRTEIRQRRALEAAAAREKEIHRNLVRSRKLVSLFATLTMVALAGLGYAVWQHRQRNKTLEALNQALSQQEAMNNQLRAQKGQLDSQKDQLNSTLTTARAEEKSLAAAKQSLTEKIKMLRIKDETLEAGAEHESAEKIKALWDALVDPKPGESDRVRDALSLLESDSDRFRSSASLQRRNAMGHALAAQILYFFGALHDGFAAAQQASAMADSLSDDPAAASEIRQAHAAALVALGRGELEMGRYDAAANHLQSGLALAAEASGTGSQPIDRNREIAALARVGLGDISLLHYSDEEARVQYTHVLHLAEAAKNDPVLEFCEALAYQLIAISYYQDATPADDRNSDQAFRHAHALLRRMMHDNPNNLRWRSLYAETTGRQAMVLDNREKYSDAFPLLQEIRPIAEEVFNADQSNESSRYVLAMIDRGLGKVYQARGDAANAAVVFTRAVENAHAVVTQQPDWIKAGILYGLALREQVFTLPEQKQARKNALVDSRTEFELLATVAKDNPQVLYYAADLNQEIGTVEAEEEEAKQEKDYAAAENSYSQAAMWFDRMTPELRQRPNFAEIEALRNFNKGYYIFRPLKRLAEEEDAYQKAAAMYAGLIEKAPSTLNYQNLGITHVNLGDAHLAAGDPIDKAVQEFQKALSTYDEGAQYLKKQGQNSIPLLANGIEQQVRIAGVWRQNKQYERAESSLQAAVTALRTSLQPDILQPELLVVRREADTEANALEEAILREAASEARDGLLTNLRKTKTDINLGKFLWPKGANPNAAGNLLDVPETLGWSAPPLVPGAWLQLSNSEQAQEQKKLATGGEIAAKVAPNILRIRKLHVTFYPEATLFEAEVRRSDGVTGVFDYVRSGDKVMELDGTSNPIHKFEEFTAADKGIPRKLLRLDTSEQASQYMHFFIGALSTEEGTFRVVNSVADMTFLPEASLEARENLGRVLKPFRLLQNSDGKWVGEASIQYSDSISYAVLTIDTTTVSTVVDMKSETAAAAYQPLQSEFVINGLRILSDYPHRRNLLTSEVDKQRKANNWQAELHAESQLVPLIRDTEVLSSTKRSELLIPRYLALSWLLLLSRDFKGALDASEAGLKLNPKELSLDTNRAHALLFLGRRGDAMEIYRKNIGESISKRSWEEIILDDLDQLEKNKVTNPAFGEIRDMMHKAKPGL
jgi:tetratricopeptide (TPR) repeat protein